MSTIFLFKVFNRFKSFKTIYYSSRHNISYLLTKLDSRKLIGVKGNDSYDYIQGLVTNDVRHLCPTLETSVCNDCIHSFMLNTSGRVITDFFIYRFDRYFNDENTKHLLIEIDSQLLDSITKFLISYRIRRKVEIKAENDFDVWSLFPSVDQFDEQTIKQFNDIDINFNDSNTKDFIVVRDPRLKEIGFRLLVKTTNINENQFKEKLKNILNSKSLEFKETNVENYVKFRYRLGVGEGVKDFPIEMCFPLECNGDFLHAISFQKGCYVGQELTARIYHTGVIRKRLMPIEIIDGNDNIESIHIQNVVTTDGKNVGKFRTNCGAYGLALLKFEECLKTDKLILSENGITFKCLKPFWWPKEYTKGSVISAKG